jgi:hypothetical protein
MIIKMNSWDFVIGQPGTLSSAEILTDNVSENKTHYWVSDIGVLKLNGKISKDNPLGIELTNHIKMKTESKFLERIAMTYTPINILLSKIEELKLDSYQQGVRDTQIQIKNLLGL